MSPAADALAMDAPKAAVRLSTLAAVGLLAVLTFASVMERGRAASLPVVHEDGSPFTVPEREGVYRAKWGPEQESVLVVVTTQAHLDAVDSLRGEGEATRALPLGDLAVFAASARSNRNGCGGSFLPTLGASKDIADYDGDGMPDGRFMEACHQGQWDLFHRGAPVPGTPTCGPLPMLRLELDGGALVSTGFDGPVGGQWCDR